MLKTSTLEILHLQLDRITIIALLPNFVTMPLYALKYAPANHATQLLDLLVMYAEYFAAKLLILRHLDRENFKSVAIELDAELSHVCPVVTALRNNVVELPCQLD